jgi:hypothetical protein
VKETLSRRITVTSSLNETFTDQLENRVVLRGKSVSPPTPSLPIPTADSEQIFKDDTNGFSSISDVCFKSKNFVPLWL